MYTAEMTIVRGDRFTQPVTLTRAAFDFAGATFLAQIRATPDGTVLATPTVSADTATVGTATLSISLTGTVTAALPAKCVLELSVEKSAASFGPYTVLRLTLNIDPDYAHA